MPFSHHSHSGQFCAHATHTLEEMILSAISQNFTTFCLTEHMPRSTQDLYPEEASANASETSLTQLYDGFIHEAARLRKIYSDRINLFIGFECEWIRAEDSLSRAEKLIERYGVRSAPSSPGLDLFVGSVHHVHGIPIDYDHEMYARAREVSGGEDDEKLFCDYFDAQAEMLRALKPPVVGHLDLIRLKSAQPDGSLRRWPRVWEKVERNLEIVLSYGGVLEVNASGLRKGLKEAYPMGEVGERWLAMGGHFTLSDDSHSTSQVGTHYFQALAGIEKIGIKKLACLTEVSGDIKPLDEERFPHVGWTYVPLEEARKKGTWKAD